MNNTIIGGIAVVALLVGGFAFFKPATEAPRVVGSASSPSVVGGCQDVNGVVTCEHSVAMAVSGGVASSTACSFAPLGATSTVQFASLKVSSSSATAMYIEVGKGRSYFATTTLLGTATISANVKGTTYIVATTSSSGAATVDGAFVLGAADWLVMNVGGSSQHGGTCKAIRVLN